MPRLFGFAPVELAGPRVAPLVGTPRRFYSFLDDPVGVVLDSRRHGDVVGVVGANPALVTVFGPDNLRQVLGRPSQFRHDEAVFAGPEGTQLAKLRHAIIAVNGDVHHRHRAVMQPAFQRSALEGYAQDIAAVTGALLDRWPTGPQRVDELTRSLALAVAVRCFYGMDPLGDSDELGRHAAHLVETLTQPFTILTPYNLPGLPYRRAVKLADALLGRLQQLVDDRRRHGPGGRDALSLLVHAGGEAGERLSDDELVAEATTLFIAGHETVAMTLAWTLFLLERHPAELDRVLDEIDATVGPTAPGLDDFARMPCLDRVLKESMRILPPVPTLFLRVCADEVVVGGVRLPAGANLVVSPLAEHHDERNYPQPQRFLPDRWIGLDPPPYTYLPFGAGPRTCLGATFAHHALRIMLPMILRRFRFELRDGAEVSRLTRANILLFAKGLPMTVEPYDRRPRPPGTLTGDIHQLVELPGVVRPR